MYVCKVPITFRFDVELDSELPTRVYDPASCWLPSTAAATAVGKDFEKLQLVRQTVKRGVIKLRNLVLEMRVHVICSLLFSYERWLIGQGR